MRIISGRAGGTNLFTPKDYDVRPTGDRVKESIFNILGQRMDNCCVLDAFAGTGNLGLEAWSRGAKSVVFLDKSRVSLDLVRRNVDKCHAQADCKLFCGDTLILLERVAAESGSFDLIFLDPPYHRGLVNLFLQRLKDIQILTVGGKVVAEHGADEEIIVPGGMLFWRREKYGTTAVDFLTADSQVS